MVEKLDKQLRLRESHVKSKLLKRGRELILANF